MPGVHTLHALPPEQCLLKDVSLCLSFSLNIVFRWSRIVSCDNNNTNHNIITRVCVYFVIPLRFYIFFLAAAAPNIVLDEIEIVSILVFYGDAGFAECMERCNMTHSLPPLTLACGIYIYMLRRSLMAMTWRQQHQPCRRLHTIGK